MNRIYLDNNLTTPLAKEVLGEMMPYLTDEFGVSSGLYQGSLMADEAIERAQKVGNTALRNEFQTMLEDRVGEIEKIANNERYRFN